MLGRRNRSGPASGPGDASHGGFWKILSRIFTDNAPSRALCAELGFREVGVYRRHGRLDGAWKDCAIVERLLGAAAATAEHDR